MVKWLNGRIRRCFCGSRRSSRGTWKKEATAKGYTLAGQKRPANGNNFPMVDLSNPAAREYWKNGVAKLLKLGVAAFKLDRGEENIPEDGPFKLFDGRSIRENRNAYVAMYVQATYEIASKLRGKISC
jgi:alpha-D-xyloside xylohydrolase